MKIIYYGHSCIGIETSKANLLIDPFVSGNPLANNIELDKIPADYVLLTHGHGDHVADVESVVSRTDAFLIANFEIINYYGAKGLEGHPINHGGTYSCTAFSAKMVNAIHTSTMPDGSAGGAPGGFVINADGKCLYVAGDTALTYDMKLIAEEFDVDLAVLPIGDNFTMGYADAVKAADFAGCNKVLGCHYDSFPPIKIDRNAAIDAFTAKGKELILLDIGEALEI